MRILYLIRSISSLEDLLHFSLKSAHKGVTDLDRTRGLEEEGELTALV